MGKSKKKTKKCRKDVPDIKKIMRGNLPARFCRKGIEFEHFYDTYDYGEAKQIVKEKRKKGILKNYRILTDINPNGKPIFRLYKGRI